MAIFNSNREAAAVTVPVPAGRWDLVLNTNAKGWRPEATTDDDMVISEEPVQSDSALTVRLGPQACQLFIKQS
jgi:hypothetical protein